MRNATSPVVLNARGAAIAANPDAAATYVLQHGGVVAMLSLSERIELLRMLCAQKVRELGGGFGNTRMDQGGCHQIQQAAVLILRNVRRDPAALVEVVQGLGGRRWLQLRMIGLTDPELLGILHSALAAIGQ